MILLDAPFCSDMLAQWMEETQHPVLLNAFAQNVAQSGYNLHLVEEDEAVSRIDAGERVYTNSENMLSWVVEHTHNEDLLRPIRMFKDKALMRRELRDLNPTFFFEEHTTEELDSLDFSQFKTPFVLKPSVGFGSVGVYAIESEADWQNALEDIRQHAQDWNKRFPESVVGSQRFLLEGYVTGVEYALDAFFDEQGETRLLNVLRHDFASPEDMSDRLYYTNAKLVNQMEEKFTTWLTKVNEVVQAKNFPVHVEVRVTADGEVIPIEFNPLRFAGLCSTDLAFYAYKYKTYGVYLENEPFIAPGVRVAAPGVACTNFKAIAKTYVMSLLGAAPDAPSDKTFDAEAFKARFQEVLEFRPFDVNALGSYGFLFLASESPEAEELQFLLHSDLKEFLR